MIATFDPGETLNVNLQFGLRAVAGEFVGTEFPIPSSRFVIGRSERSDLRLVSQRVSRAHCLLVVTRAGLVLADLGSRNGTAVNGTLISRSTKLKLGDQIAVGSSLFCLISMPVLTNSEPAADVTAAMSSEDVANWLMEDDGGASSVVDRHYRPEASASSIVSGAGRSKMDRIFEGDRSQKWRRQLSPSKDVPSKLPRPVIKTITRPPHPSTEDAADTVLRQMLKRAPRSNNR